MALVRRELNPQVAFLTGRISVEGDFNDALTLAPLME
jgi:putative sterol carrier protein